MKETLQQDAKQYQQLVEICSDAICTCLEGKIVEINPAGVSLLGTTDAAQLLGMSIACVASSMPACLPEQLL